MHQSALLNERTEAAKNVQRDITARPMLGLINFPPSHAGGLPHAMSKLVKNDINVM